jgi:UDP-glucose 4-epimerase
MTSTLAWVVGRGGLLGSQIERRVPREIPDATCWIPPSPRFSWDEPARLAHELGEAARAFGQAARECEAAWMVLWCAGAGGVGAPTEALARETDALDQLLAYLSPDRARAPTSSPGLLLLCSSAGGVYGSSTDLPITEDSQCSPISEYGRNKLRQEARVLRWVEETPGVSCLIARISNLYGPGQRLTRPQGLIGRLSQNSVYRRPLNIYVPLDTLRDYLYVEDAARYIVRCLGRLRQSDRRASLVKIFAAEHSVSIAGVIGIFSRVVKHPVRIICTPHDMHREQPGRLRFRSRTWTDLAPPALDLAAGIHAVHQHHLSLLQRGQLPAPPDP